MFRITAAVLVSPSSVDVVLEDITVAQHPGVPFPALLSGCGALGVLSHCGGSRALLAQLCL